MKIINTNIKDLKIIKFNRIIDARGIFFRNFCDEELKSITKRKIVQSNVSINKKKFTLRGFHYQKSPSKEGKFITCITGKIFNVTMDLRKEAKTYLKVVKIRLLSEKNDIMYIPPGCANAFLTLEKNTIIHYLMTDYFRPKTYVSFNYNSKVIKVKWPAKPAVISIKDKNAKKLFLSK